MNTSAPSAIRTSATRYVSWLRLQDVVALQGPPLLGAAFAVTHLRGIDVDSLFVLLAGNLFLMTHVFMLNDWAGVVTGDLADPNKAERVLTARGTGRREIAAVTTGLLIVSLVFFSCLGVVAAGLALAIATLSAFYSLPQFNWKGIPLLNSATHLCGGVLHFLLGYSVGHALDGRGVAIGTYFAVIFAAGHLTQEVRDHAADVRNGIRTNAVTFGPRRTFAVSLALFASAHVLFIVLAFERMIPFVLSAVVVLFLVQIYWSMQALREGLTYASVSRLQSRYRVLYAVIGASIAAALLL